MKSEDLYLDQLLGRMVVARNNRPVGRIEEFRSEQRGGYFHVVEFVIGPAGLLSRLNLGVNALFGQRAGGKVARWDQVDISRPEHPRLTCSVEDLRDIESVDES
jgi:hypothetical protein